MVHVVNNMAGRDKDSYMAPLFPLGLSHDSSECSIHFLIFSHIRNALELGLSYFLLKYKSETKKEKKKTQAKINLKTLLPVIRIVSTQSLLSRLGLSGRSNSTNPTLVRWNLLWVGNQSGVHGCLDVNIN